MESGSHFRFIAMRRSKKCLANRWLSRFKPRRMRRKQAHNQPNAMDAEQGMRKEEKRSMMTAVIFASSEASKNMVDHLSAVI